MPDLFLGTGSYVVYLISDPVLGTGSQSIFIYTGSGTGYQFLLSILFTGSVGYEILCFIFFHWIRYCVPDSMADLVLGTGSYVFIYYRIRY